MDSAPPLSTGMCPLQSRKNGNESHLFPVFPVELGHGRLENEFPRVFSSPGKEGRKENVPKFGFQPAQPHPRVQGKASQRGSAGRKTGINPIYSRFPLDTAAYKTPGVRFLRSFFPFQERKGLLIPPHSPSQGCPAPQRLPKPRGKAGKTGTNPIYSFPTLGHRHP